MTEQELNIDELFVDELKEELRKLNLQVSGNKTVLRERLRRATCGEKSVAKNVKEGKPKNEETDERDDDNDKNGDTSIDSEDDDENVATVNRRSARLPFSFKDVEDSLQTFSGDGKQKYPEMDGRIRRNM